MKLIHDYLLVKEVIPNETLGNSGLKVKYDDSERFMTVEIIEMSPMLRDCYRKEYPSANDEQLMSLLDEVYQVGNHLIINRVAKTPYKDGTYFISYKDVIGVEQSVEII